jgi:3-isopropylmalate/(R)-2-methylmalate dehydratase small subunit
VDTDRIIPARFMKAITFDGLGRYSFYDQRFDAGGKELDHPMNEPRYQAKGPRIAVVNKNFGCGSSREHAPQALRRSGIRVVVGESFSEIFFGNSLMIGLPCVTASSDEVRELMERVEERPDAILRIDLQAGTCELDGVRYAISLPVNARDALVTGAWDTTGLLLARYEEVDAVAAKLPYITGFK